METRDGHIKRTIRSGPGFNGEGGYRNLAAQLGNRALENEWAVDSAGPVEAIAVSDLSRRKPPVDWSLNRSRRFLW